MNHILDFNLFSINEAGTPDYAVRISSWDFLNKCLWQLEANIHPELIEIGFFWNEIYESFNNSFYNQKRVETQTGNRRRLGHLRISNHWNWFRNGIIHAPLKDNIDTKDWICAKWVDEGKDIIDSNLKGEYHLWELGFVYEVHPEGGYGFISSDKDPEPVYLPKKLVDICSIKKGDRVLFKKVIGDGGRPFVIRILPSVQHYDILVKYERGFKGQYASQIRTLMKQVRYNGYSIFLDCFKDKKIVADLKISIKMNSKWIDLVGCDKTRAISEYYFKLSDGSKVKVDDNGVRFDYKVKIKDKSFLLDSYNFDELKAELYRLKRVYKDMDPSFKFMS